MVDELIRCLNSRDKDIRSEAMWALEKIGNQKAIGPIIRCLTDKHSDIRADAVKTLGKIGDESAVLPIIKAVDMDRTLRDAAEEAFQLIVDRKRH